MKFEKFEDRRKSTYVLEQLLKAIREGQFQIGDKLPSEGELTEMIGVSRTSVREALAALRLTGVVTSRAGRGTYLNKIPSKNNRNMKERAISMLQESASPTEMLEARATIEESIARLALERIEEQDLKKLERSLKGMSKADKEEDNEKFLSKNREFHLTIAESTGNTAIKEIMDSILLFREEELSMEERRLYYEHNQELLHNSLKIHNEIFNAFKNRNREALSDAIKTHYQQMRI